MKRHIYILLIAFTAILNCSDLSGMPRGSLRTAFYAKFQTLIDI